MRGCVRARVETLQVSAVCRLVTVGLAYRAILGVCFAPPAALYAARQWRAVNVDRRRVRILGFSCPPARFDENHPGASMATGNHRHHC
jgi:hypothetical protein